MCTVRSFIILLVVASALGAGAWVLYFVKTHRAYSVPSSSMEPTIMQGEKILVDPDAYDHAAPLRGAVVIIQHKPDNLFIAKRVIAIGGDTIEGRKGNVFLNGRFKVNPGELFVMGDNRDVAYDSRQPQYGSVPQSELRGRVLSIGSSPIVGRAGKEVH